MGWFDRDKKSPAESGKKSVEQSEEKIRNFVAAGKAAEKIVNEYGGVLEITSNMTYGAPQSLLPRPKEEMKEAIKTYLRYLHVTEELDESWFNLLDYGYAKLSSFLSDADAKIAIAGQADFNAGLAAHNSKNTVQAVERMTSPNFSAALARSTKSLEEYKALSKEFNALAAKLGIKFAMTPDQQNEAYAQAVHNIAQTGDLFKDALNGDAEAQYLIAYMYDQGKDIPQDDAEAVKWYRKAADQGNGPAQHILGMHYRIGIGVEKDFAEAVKWYRRAADQGLSRAQFDLGNAYSKGDGVAQDYLLAYKWFTLAASSLTDENKRAKTITYRDNLTSLMTPTQVAEAQRQVAEWRPIDSRQYVVLPDSRHSESKK
jgi:TPR repeat protein